MPSPPPRSPPASSGAPPPPPTRSRARRWPTAPGPSNWHRFAHTPGRVANGDTGDVACDHYRRWPEDVALMRDWACNAYRFSVAWAASCPTGTRRGEPRRASTSTSGWSTRCSQRGIAPLVTLYHWDLPAALDDRGGWLEPRQRRLVRRLRGRGVRALGDRVPLWATLNEPWVVVDGGYLHGALAPGPPQPVRGAARRAQPAARPRRGGAGYRARGPARGSGQIGLVVNLEPKDPATDAPEDLAATARADAYMNRQYLDPVFLGRYPEELPEIFGEALAGRSPAADFALIGEPIDFLGVNYYTRGVTADDARAAAHAARARCRKPGADLHRDSAGRSTPRA